MTTEEMTVHDALAAIKVADARIEKEIGNATFCAANRRSNTLIGGVTVEQFNENAKASFQKITDLINRRNALKEAVAQSNASTKITVNGKEYSIAEAIYQYKEGLGIKKELLENLQIDYRASSNTVKEKNEVVRIKCDEQITNNFGGKDKTNEADIEAFEKNYIAHHSYDFVDPLSILDKIKTLSDEIDKETAEFDSKIQTSNATTIIKIAY